MKKRQRAPGGGRKSALVKFGEPLERHTLTLLKSHADYLRTLAPTLSEAIRILINQTRRT